MSAFTRQELIKKLTGHLPGSVRGMDHDTKTCDMCRWGETLREYVRALEDARMQNHELRLLLLTGSKK